jgi:hypothetical protein
MGVDDLLADLAEAVDAAAELVDLGKQRWDSERPLRLAGEAVIGRVGNVLEHVAVLGNGLPGPAAHPVIEPAINGPSLRRRRPGQLRCCRSSRQVPE